MERTLVPKANVGELITPVQVMFLQEAAAVTVTVWEAAVKELASKTTSLALVGTEAPEALPEATDQLPMLLQLPLPFTQYRVVWAIKVAGPKERTQIINQIFLLFILLISCSTKEASGLLPSPRVNCRASPFLKPTGKPDLKLEPE
jgi:hypothetical protein